MEFWLKMDSIFRLNLFLIFFIYNKSTCYTFPDRLNYINFFVINVKQFNFLYVMSENLDYSNNLIKSILGIHSFLYKLYYFVFLKLILSH